MLSPLFILKKEIRLEQILLWSLVLLSLTPLVFDTQGYSKFRVPKYLYFLSILLPLCLFAFLKRHQVRQIRYNGFIVSFGLLAVSVVFAQFSAFDRHMSLYSTFERMEGLWYYVSLLLLFATCASIPLDTLAWSAIFKAWTAVAMVVVLGGALFDNDFGVLYRFSSTLGNPSYLSHYLLVSLYLLFLTFDTIHPIRRFYYLAFLGAVLLLTGIFFTFSRTTYLGLLIGLFLYFIIQLHKGPFTFQKIQRWAIVLLISTLITTGCLFGLFHDRIFYLLTNTTTLSDRIRLWKIALSGISERPLLGWGLDNFPYVYEKYQQGFYTITSTLYDRSHNVFLDWYLHGGLMSLCSYSIIWLLLLRYIWLTALVRHSKALLTSWWAVSIFYLLLNIDNIVNWILLIVLSLYVINHLPVSYFRIIQSRKIIGLYYTVILLVGISLFQQSYVKTIQAYHLSRKFAVTERVEEKVGIVQLMVRAGFPANHTMATPFCDNCFIVKNSNEQTSSKNEFIRLTNELVQNEISKRPPSVYLLNLNAGLNTLVKNDEAASRSYKSILQINPKILRVYLQHGKLLLARGNPQKAYDYFEKAENMHPAYSEASLLKIKAKAQFDSTYRFEIDILNIPVDDRIKHASLIGSIFRNSNRVSDYVLWIWKGGYQSSNGTTPLVLYEFATSAYATGDMVTFKKMLQVYEANFHCSPQFSKDVLALINDRKDPSHKLLEYKAYYRGSQVK